MIFLGQKIHRVRGLVLTDQGGLLLIKRKRHGPPWWVTPGGAVEPSDATLEQALQREMMEELGARVRVRSLVHIMEQAFPLQGRISRQAVFLCRLLSMDLALRNGPEIHDPDKGEYLPDCVPLEKRALEAISLQPQEMKGFLTESFDKLLELPDLRARRRL